MRSSWLSVVFVSAVWVAVTAACATGSTATTSGLGETPTCSATAAACGGGCVELASDNANCGACGAVCKSGEVCSRGACASSCGGGTTLCGATCNDTQVDAINCGACGTKCAAGEVCSSGKCGSSCDKTQTRCGSSCVNAATDNANCGACGVLCGAGQVCSGGKCGLTCQSGLTLCSQFPADAGPSDGGANPPSGTCANLKSDNVNCGACGVTCGGGKQCASGACVTTCGAGMSQCTPGDGGAPYCANLPTDNANCGSCGVQCGAGQQCASGACVTTCGGALTQCPSGDGGAPYCADTKNDPQNCSTCGKACASGPNATAVCASGKCALICASGFADCDLVASNGCEVNVSNDPKNCGACGKVCNNSCASGSCVSIQLLGSFNVNQGPAWGSNPPTYTCQEACAVVFGGVASTYQCSTASNTPNRQANTTVWGVGGCKVVADTVKVNSNYNCGSANCSESAYCADNCSGVNYCFK